MGYLLWGWASRRLVVVPVVAYGHSDHELEQRVAFASSKIFANGLQADPVTPPLRAAVHFFQCLGSWKADLIRAAFHRRRIEARGRGLIKLSYLDFQSEKWIPFPSTAEIQIGRYRKLHILGPAEKFSRDDGVR